MENSIAISNTGKMSQWELADYERLPGDEFIVNAIFTPAMDRSYKGAALRFQMQDGHPVLIELTIQDSTGEIGEYNRLAPETVRTFPVASLVAQVELSFSDSLPLDDALPDFEALRAEWPKGDLNKVSKAVATVYNAAAMQNVPRQDFVKDAFNVSKATAGRMIAKARELGYIRISGAVGRPKTKGTDHGEKETTDR